MSNYSVGQGDHVGLLKNATKNQPKNFGGSEIMPTFASQSGKRLHRLAKIAQLVEHDLAKVGVAGSSPVFRSKRTLTYFISRQSAGAQLAKIAQLVEHDLAKVGVAGSSPVFRSDSFSFIHQQ